MDLLTPDFGVFFWQSIILLVVIFILGKFTWKPALTKIKNRENFISDSLNKAVECNKRVAKIETECFEIVKNANVEKSKILDSALNERKEIINKAQVEAKHISDKIITDIEQSIKEYKKEAVQNSKKDILDLSVEIAEKILGKALEEEHKQKDFLNFLIDEELKKQENTPHHEAF